MLMTAPSTATTAATGPDRVATQRLFNDLAVDLSRHDAQLESMVRNGNAVGSGWGEWFDSASQRLLAGRDAYAVLQPNDTAMIARLGTELLDLSSNGGRIASASERGATLGSGWATALDGVLATVQQASNRL